MTTPSTRACCFGVITSTASCRDGKVKSCSKRLVPAQSSSVLSMFSFSRLPAIHWLMSRMQCSSLTIVDDYRRDGSANITVCRHSSDVSEGMDCHTARCSSAKSARSAVYRIKSRGPSTDPCGTEHSMKIVDDIEQPYRARKDLPNR